MCVSVACMHHTTSVKLNTMISAVVVDVGALRVIMTRAEIDCSILQLRMHFLHWQPAHRCLTRRRCA